MNYPLSLLGLALFITFGAFGQSGNSMLWKITTEDGKESYLFGTYHLMGSDYLEEHPLILESFERCTTVVVETEIDSSKMTELSMMGMMMGHTLWEFYDTAEYELVDRKLEEKLGYGLDVLGMFKPVVTGLMYTMAVVNEDMSETEANVGGELMDLYFTSEGRKYGKEIQLLETMQEQAEILYNSQSLEEQAEMLLEVVKDSGGTDLSSEQLLQLYLDQDLKGIEKIAKEADRDMTMDFVMVEERNEKWVPKLQPLLDEGGAFIAVGALHLPGKKGLLKLLKAEGYKIEAVDN